MDNTKQTQDIHRREAINREYGLQVKVDVRMIDIEDVNSKGQRVTYKSRMVYLVPQVSTQASAFFDAWLPDVAYKFNDPKDASKGQTIMHHELAVKFSAPLHKVVRCGICRKNKNYPDNHHLILMNAENAEETLATMHGQTLAVFVMPDSVAESSIN